ncbi:hypothetical protein BTM25_31220 [Actinomadura rubteroloni]|uniref:Uncharacterized protein n=1 Tax=Actinomadura rubteroloni TaxID=1926885 RepID=A0A2P4UHF5_9ACTN|nr:hypothetical protein [Actinomadura rubteroloni]POM24493.1 hypothetical protein BTM25_31220 [Actinomadura rubteroloni]
MSEAAARPPLDRDAVDDALRVQRDERDRVSAALLDLEAQPGYRLLTGASVTGATALAREEIRARAAELWDWFDRYTRTLRATEDLRARHGRPGRAELAELTRLLTGPSVAPPEHEVPLADRTLLAAPPPPLTLAAVVERMTALYEDVVRRVAAVDGAWSALLPALERAEAARREVGTLAAELGGDPEAARLTGELDRVAATVRADPLATAPPELDRLGADLAALRDRLRAAVRMRAEAAARLAALDDAVALVRAEEDDARRTRADVLTRISAPPPPDVPALAAALADRCAAVRGLGAAGRWRALTDRVAELEDAAADALRRVREARDLAAGLTERRDELRGRLEAYRMKAARLGHAEDADLAGRYARTRELLWSAPCDLRRATVALSGYQEAVSARAKGSDR